MKLALKSSMAVFIAAMLFLLTMAVLAATMLLLMTTATPAHAFDYRNPRARRNLSPQLLQKLEDQLSNEVQPYFTREDEKRDNGKTYVDLQQKFEYLPNYGPRGSLVVSAKLGGAQYNPALDKSNPKGAPTGVLKYLVFTYALEHGKWVEVARPRWETQNLGPRAAAEMRRRSDEVAKMEAERKRVAEAAAAKQQAAQEAAAAAKAKAEAQAQAAAAAAWRAAHPHASPTPAPGLSSSAGVL